MLLCGEIKYLALIVKKKKKRRGNSKQNEPRLKNLKKVFSWLDLVKVLQVQYQKKLCVICFDTPFPPALVLDTGDILVSSWGELQGRYR